MSTQPRKPAGSPNSTGGEYDFKPGMDGLPDMSGLSRSDRRRAWARLDAQSPAWQYSRELLAASRPKADGTDETGTPVCDPMTELDLVDQVVGSEQHLGPAARAFNTMIDDRVQCVMLAEQYMNGRLDSLRRMCASDPARCYSRELVEKAVHARVRVSRLLRLPPYSMSEHRTRVGMRYVKRLEEYKAAHQCKNPSGSIRDQVWDNTLADYIHDKISRGVSFGSGLYYSTGHNADPNKADMTRSWGDGVYNGRKNFEVMRDNCMRQCRQASFDEGFTANTLAAADHHDGDDIKNMFFLLFDRNMGEAVEQDAARQLGGISPDMIDQWRIEWMAANGGAGRPGL